MGLRASRIHLDLHSAAGLLALFTGVEFSNYWEHRLSHRVRCLWATHAVLAMMGLNLLYQCWLHTELVPSLGLLDRKPGGVLMLFDQLFGTWQREVPGIAPRYGLVGASADAGAGFHPPQRWRVLPGPP